MTTGTNVNLFTATDFAAFAPEISTAQYDAATISGMITAASQLASDYLGYTPIAEAIVGEQRSGKVTSQGDLVIYPSKIPIISLASIALNKGTTSISLTLQDGSNNNRYNIDYNKRSIILPYGELTLQGVPLLSNLYNLRGYLFYTTLSYTAGWPLTELPTPIKQAAMLFMRDMIARRNNTTGARKVQQGGISLEYAEKTGDSELVKDAKTYLRPYRRIG